MAKDKKKNFTNTVKIVGYLKENNLEQITDKKGQEAIRGSLIIATDKISSHKVQFYVSEKTFSGEDSKEFANLSALLPDNTVTIASYLKENSDANFDTACNAASKVWIMGRFEEYASRSGERVSSFITIKGFRAGFSKVDKAPFTPCSEFEVEAYINKMDPEKGEDGQETGRVEIEGLVPRYNGYIDKIDFVAVSEDKVAKYISTHYAVGDTVKLKGDVVNIAERKLSEKEDEDFFGRSSGPQYETTFVHERRVVGGCKVPLHAGEEGSITTEMVKEGLAARELKMEQNGERAMSRGNSATNPAPTSAPSASSRKTSSVDDLDF